MSKKTVSILLALVVALTILPALQTSAAEKPTSIGAPYNIGASTYSPYWFIYLTYTAPRDLRDIMYKTKEELGYNLSIYAQVDEKVDNGSWQYTSDWDGSNFKKYTFSPFPTASKNVLAYHYCHGRYDSKFQFPALANAFDDCKSWDWYKTHSVSIRARFAVQIDSQVIFSDWSDVYVISDGSKMDYEKIIRSNTPVIKSNVIELRYGVPHLVLTMEDDADDILKLDAACGHTISEEVWIKRTGDADFIKLASSISHTVGQNLLSFNVGSYFTQASVGDPYELKVRYVFNARNYQPSGVRDNTYLYSPYSGESTFIADSWAMEWLEKADAYDLIPDSLRDKDLKKNITRREFAAVSVKLYEKLTDTKSTPIAVNPFSDTNDVEVLKAYNIGITDGTGGGKFSPDLLLSREEAATMLTRVLKAAYIQSWTLKTDNTFVLNFTMPAKFADDDKISGWAKPSVYFMAANKIIQGTGNNMFSPRATTSAEQATNYASATCQEALIIAARTVENLKDKPLDYTDNGG